MLWVLLLQPRGADLCGKPRWHQVRQTHRRLLLLLRLLLLFPFLLLIIKCPSQCSSAISRKIGFVSMFELGLAPLCRWGSSCWGSLCSVSLVARTRSADLCFHQREAKKKTMFYLSFANSQQQCAINQLRKQASESVSEQ